MKQTLRYALIAVLGAAVMTPAFAQDNFPDTPEAHWAAEALTNMKREGILVGYPDGLYRGGRPASRYEMAVALNALWMKIKGMLDGWSGQMDTLMKALDELKGLPGEVKDLKDQVAAMKADMDTMKGWGDTIKNLQKMADMFKDELASMGVDVAAMKKMLADHEDRIKALEARKPAVDISGDVNFLLLAGHGDGKGAGARNGITWNGRLTGVGRGDYAGRVVGMSRDVSVFHEAAFTFKGTNTEGPQWWATIAAGNLIPGFDNQSHTGSYGTGYQEGRGDAYIQSAGATFSTSLMGLKFSATGGRIGYKISPYILARQDRSPEFMNSRWDDGKWTMDGAVIAFNFGGAAVNVLAGRNSAFTTMGAGSRVQDMTTGGGPNMASSLRVDQTLGVHVNIPMTDKGGIDLAYLWLDSNVGTGTTKGKVNRTNVYGADAHYKFNEAISAGAGYSKSDFSYNTSNKLNKDNAAWYAKLGYGAKNWGLSAGYRRVEENFGAPGAWGRLGLVYNPTNIQGFMGKVFLGLSPELEVTAKAEFYEGVKAGTKPNKIDSFGGALNYKFGGSWNANFAYENTTFKRSGSPKAEQAWFTVGLGWTMSERANLHLMYQVSDVKNRAGNWMGNFGLGANRFKGGLLGTQLTIKF